MLSQSIISEFLKQIVQNRVFLLVIEYTVKHRDYIEGDPMLRQTLISDFISFFFLLWSKRLFFDVFLTIEELTRIAIVGFEFRNEEFKPQYENLEDIETLMFTEKVIKAVSV